MRLSLLLVDPLRQAGRCALLRVYLAWAAQSRNRRMSAPRAGTAHAAMNTDVVYIRLNVGHVFKHVRTYVNTLAGPEYVRVRTYVVTT